MKKRIIALVCVLVIILSVNLFADTEDFNIWFYDLTLNPTVTGYFNQKIIPFQNKLMDKDFFPVLLDFKFREPTAEGILGGMIPLSDNFYIPLFFEVIFNNTVGDYVYSYYGGSIMDYQRFSLGISPASGLVIKGEYGLLGIYVGYKWENGFEKEIVPGKGRCRNCGYEGPLWNHECPNCGESGSPGVIWSINSEISDNKPLLMIFPVIDAEKYPLLNIFVKLIDGFISLDGIGADEFKPTYKANVLFRDINLGGWYFTLGAYTTKDWYDFNAKYNLYAGKLNISNGDTFMVSLEGGWRDFFDVKPSEQQYENGIYSKISINFIIADSMGFQFYANSSTTAFFNNPTFGFMMSLFGDGLKSNMGYTQPYTLQFGMGFN